MPQQYLSTDPNAGQPVGTYLSTDPTAGRAPGGATIGDHLAAKGSPFMRGATEFYRNSPIGAAVNLAAGTADAVGLTGHGFHPIDALWNAGKDVARAQWDQAVQAAEKAKEAAGGDKLSAAEALGHGIAAVVPLLGPAAANVGEHFAQGDMAGGIGGALGLLMPFAAKYGVDAVKSGSLVPTPARVNAAAATTAAGDADLLRREANQIVSQRVLAPGNPKYKPVAAKLAPEVLSRRLSDTVGRTGDARLQFQQMAAEGKADALTRIDAAAGIAPTAPVDLSPVVKSLDDAIAKSYVNGKLVPGEEQNVAALKAQRDFVASHGQTLPFSDVRDLRQILDRQASEAGAYVKRGDATYGPIESAAVKAAGALRDQIVANRPELAGPNADYAFWSRLADVLDESKGRPKQTNYVPSGVTGGMSTTGAVVGAAAGDAAAKIPGVRGVAAFTGSQLMPRLKALTESPAWKLASAQKKADLADAISAGQAGRAKTLMLQIAAFAPRGMQGWAASPVEAQSRPDDRRR